MVRVRGYFTKISKKAMEVHNYDSISDRLLPCPFCGSAPTWHLKGNEFTRSQKIVIKCPKCRIQRSDAILNCNGHTIEWLEEVAIKNWNQRTKETEPMNNNDEKIREALIKFHKSTIDIDGVKGEDIVAWIEKQGEPKQEENDQKSEPFRIKKGKWYVCIHDFCHNGIRIGEIIQAEHDNTIRGIGFLYMENKYFRPAFENEIPQKSKWSEEDESKVKDVIYFLDTAKVHYASTKALDDYIDWLKSLKQRLEEQR